MLLLKKFPYLGTKFKHIQYTNTDITGKNCNDKAFVVIFSAG